MDIIVHGYTGRMGQTICRLAEDGFAGAQVAARVSVDCPNPGENGCYTKLTDFTGKADCVVDFSHHAATNALLDYCVERNLPAVIATTGQTELEKAAIVEAAKKIPVFFSANYSLGVAVLAELAQKAAAMFPEADIEIVETHHNQKLDVPSGTALPLPRQAEHSAACASVNTAPGTARSFPSIFRNFSSARYPLTTGIG